VDIGNLLDKEFRIDSEDDPGSWKKNGEDARNVYQRPRRNKKQKKRRNWKHKLNGLGALNMK